MASKDLPESGSGSSLPSHLTDKPYPDAAIHNGHNGSKPKYAAHANGNIIQHSGMEEATLESGVPSPTETGLKKAKSLVNDGVQFPAQLLDGLALL